MGSKTGSQTVSQGSDTDASTFIRQSNLLRRHVPFSAATLWRLVKAGRFPRPVKVTPQITAWRLSDVHEWVKDPAGYIADSQGSR